MTVSGSVDFKLTAGEIVEEARSILGIHADEEPMEAHELTKGLRALNMMLKEWQADGVVISTMTEGTFALVQGDVDYVIGAGGTFTTVPFEILSIRINRGGNDLPMLQLSREEYFDLPNKTTEGFPTQWYYDRQRSGGTLYVWPAPDATAGTLKFTYKRLINDMDASANDLDLPQEWFNAVCYGLARKLIPRYGKAASAEARLILAEAEASYRIVKGFDAGTGKNSIMITPAGYDGY